MAQLVKNVCNGGDLGSIHWILCTYIIAAGMGFVKAFLKIFLKKSFRTRDTQYIVVATFCILNLCDSGAIIFLKKLSAEG